MDTPHKSTRILCTTRPQLRMRLSTLLLILPFLTLVIHIAVPLGLYLGLIAPQPDCIDHGLFSSKVMFYLNDVSGQMLVLAALINLFAVVFNLAEARWWACGQNGLEITLGVMLFIQIYATKPA